MLKFGACANFGILKYICAKMKKNMIKRTRALALDLVFTMIRME